MGCCCVPGDYGEFFGEKVARRDARRYRRGGLDRAARRMVGFLGRERVTGATVLEVGGGVGAIQLELLRAGAGRAVNVELSPAYEDVAAELAREAGVEARVERQVGDFVADGSVEPADVVVLHRVVCCYPDYEALLAVASEHARRVLVFSFPRDTPLYRLGARVMNVFLRLRRRAFRVHVHPAAAMLDVPRKHGLRPAYDERGPLWRVAAFER